mmetsp:Transcript_17475/g.33430  ORF Transcript_17475/g.33430 Transcript_17475/m.33430 type:complete len:349 (-) Transcript_17475:209-1255(-)
MSNPPSLSSTDSLSGHTDRVWNVAWAPDGKMLASCSGDRTVRLWIQHNSSWVCSAILEDVHQRTIRAVGWDRTGCYLALGSFDATTSIWHREGEDWACVSTLEGHENEVKSVAWHPHSDVLATCGRDKTVWIWEMQEDKEFECVSVLNGHTQDVKHVSWHPAGDTLVSASYDDSIKLWVEDPDEQDWACAKTLATKSSGQGHTSTVWAVTWHPSGARMASCSDDLAIIVWERASDSGSTAEGWTQACSISGYHTRAVFSVHFSPDGKFIASAAADNSVRIFAEDEAVDLEPGSSKKISFTQLVAEEAAHSEDINCVQWCPVKQDGIYLLATAGDDGLVKIWRFQAGSS